MIKVYRAVFTSVIYTYRAIIHKSNLHHCLENAILYFFRLVEVLDFGKEVVIELFSLFTPSSPMKIRLRAFLGRC